MSEAERDGFTAREMYLMRQAMDAGTYYESLEQWLDETISDAGHYVAQHLAHDAERLYGAAQAPASGEVEPVYQPDQQEQAAFRKALMRSADVVHPPAKVPEGYVLVEKGIVPTHVLEAGLGCFQLLNRSGIADDRTLVLAVFQDMINAADMLGGTSTTPTPATTPEAEWPAMPDKFYEGLGWVHAECCAALDRGEDPRTFEVGDMVKRCIRDLTTPPQEQ